MIPGIYEVNAGGRNGVLRAGGILEHGGMGATVEKQNYFGSVRERLEKPARERSRIGDGVPLA
jgi:hypothetical protein